MKLHHSLFLIIGVVFWGLYLFISNVIQAKPTSSLKVDTVYLKVDSITTTWETYEYTSCSINLKKLDNRFKLVKNDEGKYAIKIKNVFLDEDGFLWQMRSKVYWHFEPITTFDDSCQAKLLAKKYVDQEKERLRKINAFK